MTAGAADDLPDVPVLHRDEDLLAVDKPGGWLVHRSRESSDRRFLLQVLRDRMGRRLYPVHRLDRAASGVLLFAFAPPGAAALHAALAAGTKRYVALVRGEIAEHGEIDRPLTDDRGVKREARTRWWRLECLDGFSVIEVEIDTGRRHQIRRHLAHLAHQIVGDTTYGKGRINRWLRDAFGLPRLFLHASRVELAHPSTGAPLALGAPLAADLAAFLDRFRGS